MLHRRSSPTLSSPIVRKLLRCLPGPRSSYSKPRSQRITFIPSTIVLTLTHHRPFSPCCDRQLPGCSVSTHTSSYPPHAHAPDTSTYFIFPTRYTGRPSIASSSARGLATVADPPVRRYGGLKDQDRIFTNIYCKHDHGIKGAKVSVEENGEKIEIARMDFH